MRAPMRHRHFYSGFRVFQTKGYRLVVFGPDNESCHPFTILRRVTVRAGMFLVARQLFSGQKVPASVRSAARTFLEDHEAEILMGGRV